MSQHDPFLPESTSRRGLAGMLAALEARVDERADAASLHVRPLSGLDALEPWRTLAGDHTAVLFGFDRLAGARPLHEPRWPDGPTDELSPALVTDPATLCQLVEAAGLDSFAAVAIEGPVEPADIDAIDAVVRGNAPLHQVELRTVAAVRTKPNGAILVDVRDTRDAARFVAEALRRYLADLRRQPLGDFAAPEPGVVERILTRSGFLRVRPIETEVYSTSIDVGISTDPEVVNAPADAALIYDIYSATWYAD